MSWWNLFSNPPKEKYVPILNALEQQRLKQIETLRTFHPSVTEIRKDVEYKINIFINENALDICVFLPPNFPNEIPVVTISPAIKHPWVNDQMVVIGCESINTFYMHSNLGRALQDICKEFYETPPTFCQYTNIPVTTTRSLNNHEPPGGTLVELNQAVEQPNLSFPTMLDGLSKISGTLNDYSIEELKELNSNPEKISELVSSLDLMSTSTEERENHVSNIVEIARENREERQTRLEAARDNFLTKYEELSLLREKFDHWSLKQNDLFEMHTPHRIHVALQIAAAQADEEAERSLLRNRNFNLAGIVHVTENVAEDFLNEKIEIEEFLKRFVEKRKLTHIRHWKEENVLKL